MASLAKDLPRLACCYKMTETKRLYYHVEDPFLAHYLREDQGPASVTAIVLEVCRERVVRRVDRPAVPLAYADVVVAQGDGSIANVIPGWRRGRAGPAVVRDLRVLVHLAPDPVETRSRMTPYPASARSLIACPTSRVLPTRISRLCRGEALLRVSRSPFVASDLPITTVVAESVTKPS